METTTYPPGQEYHPDNYVSEESVRLHAEEIMRDPTTYLFGTAPSNIATNNLVNSYQDWLDEDSPTRETDIYEYRYNVGLRLAGIRDILFVVLTITLVTR